MSFDPYATLGLPRSATSAEIKRAYRRLAKQFHPDAAGQAAMPRFLAIQAAYELLTTGRGGAGGGPGRPASGPAAGSGPGPSPGDRPSGGGWSTWTADPNRARATRERYREAYRERARQAGESGPAATGPDPSGPDRAGSAGRSSRPKSSRSTGEPATGRRTRSGGPAAGGPAADGPEARGSAPGPGSRSRGRTGRSRRKATLGSTSYDEAAREPFEPGWSGAGWYGATSGTYWTINPREYADPRKHGPEYQARAARAAAASAPGQPAADEAPGGIDADRDVAAEPSADEAAEPIRETPRTGGSGDDWSAAWRAAEARTPGADAGRPAGPHGPTTATRSAGNGPATTGPARAGTSRGPSPADALLDFDVDGLVRRADPLRPAPTGSGRLIVALLGAFAPVIAILAASAELTGCARAAATCRPGDEVPGLLVSGLLFVALVLLTAPARVLAHGGIGVLFAALPAAVVLSISGGPADLASAALALWILLAAAWLLGVAIGLRRSLAGRLDVGTPEARRP